MEKVIVFSLFVALLAVIVTANDVKDPCVVEDPLNHGTYAPHPTNCSQYLQCTQGFFSERSCPEGLHWSAEEVACQWPEEAGCDENITVDPPVTDDDVTTEPTTSSDPPTTDDDVTTDPTTSSDPPTTDDDVTTDPTTSSDPPTTDDDVTTDPTTSSDPPTTDDDVTTDPTTSSDPPTTEVQITTDTTRPL